MAFLQKVRAMHQKFDPVAKWAGKKSDDLGFTPSFMYPPDPEPTPIVRPVTEAGKAREAAARAGQTMPDDPRRRRVSTLLGRGGRGLLGGG